jgi:hypothetical protein
MAGDWWLRAMPMFGGHEERTAYEGYVHPSDATFALTAGLFGERHLLVLGHGKFPVKTFSVDVTVGTKNDVGVIDLSATCPVRADAKPEGPRL